MSSVITLNRRNAAAGLGKLDVQGIINNAFNSFNTWINSKYAKDASRSTGIYAPGGQNGQTSSPNPYAGLTPEQIAALQAAQGNQIASGSITGAGIQFGGSVVSWPVIALMVGAFMLLQARPVSRR